MVHKYCIIVIILLNIYLTKFTNSTQDKKDETNGFLPVHPQLKESDKLSVPLAKGKEIKLGNLTVYQSPYANDTKIMLITIYDIFGLHPHVKYIADKLSESGFLVVIPDIFHGNPVPLENFPKKDFMQRAVHLFDKNGSWVENKPDILSVMKYYKEEHGITGIGMYGFCWGGKISVFAASDSDFKDLKAVGLVHPSRITNEDANEMSVPAILLPSNSEPDMLPFLKILKKNVQKVESEHFRFDKMSHGFAGARADFSDESIRQNVDNVIQRLAGFFEKALIV